ncbi:hypothetical protein BDQ12DRAFT_687885, partial [Crucibulum laeve]
MGPKIDVLLSPRRLRAAIYSSVYFFSLVPVVMPFFQNASDVHIESSDFKDVAGDYIHNDNSRVTTNTNSNNRTINRTIGSYNTSTHIDRSRHETNNTNHGAINVQHNAGHRLYGDEDEHSDDEEYEDEPLSSLHPQSNYQNTHSNPQPRLHKYAPQALPNFSHGQVPPPAMGTRRNTRQLAAKGTDMNADHLLWPQQVPAYGYQHGHPDVHSQPNLTMPLSPFDVPPRQQSPPPSQYGFNAQQQYHQTPSGYASALYNPPYQGGPLTPTQSSDVYGYNADSAQQSHHNFAQQPYHHSGSYLQQPQPRPHLTHTTSEPLSVPTRYKSNNPFNPFVVSAASSPPETHTDPGSFDARYLNNDEGDVR